MSKVKIKASFTYRGRHYAAGEVHDAKDIPQVCMDLTEVYSSDDLSLPPEGKSSDELSVKNKIMSRRDLKQKSEKTK